MIKTGRKLAAASALTLLFAVLASLNAFACTSGPGGASSATGGGSAAGGGSGIATTGGQASPFGSISFDGATLAALSGFVILVAAGVLAILLIKTLRRPRRNLALMAQLSSDGRYWWDGTAWHDGHRNPPPPSLRSADGAYWWDGRSWLLAPAS